MPILTQIQAVASRPTNWTDTVTLNQIDPALDIQSLTLSLTGTLASGVTVVSGDLAPSQFLAYDNGSVLLQRSDGSTLLQVAPYTIIDTVLAAAGSEAASTVAFTAESVRSEPTSYGSSQAGSPDATLLTGTGTVALPVAASARVSATGPGNLRVTFASQIGADISLRAVTPVTAPVGPAAGTYSLIISQVSTGNLPPSFGPESTHSAPQLLTVADDITGATSALTLNGFDSALGRLQAVTITVSADTTGAAEIENLDPVAGPVTIGHNATVTLHLPDGTTAAASSATFSTTRQLAAFDGTDDLRGASATAFAESAPTGSITATTATLTGASLAAFETAGLVTLDAARTGQTAINGPGNLDVATALQAGAAISVSYTYATSDISYTTAQGTTGTALSEAYSGPVAGLQWQYIWSGSDGIAFTAASPNAFLKGGAGADALQSGGGNNVLDGGGGSNFLVGGTAASGGHDTFFVDGRLGAETWSTLVNFHQGDSATIFGFHAGTSTMPLTALDGADGYTGLTIHAELAGAGTGVNQSVTFAGIDQATAAQHFVFSTGTLPGDIDYLLIQYQ